jgi:hypothetical protein
MCQESARSNDPTSDSVIDIGRHRDQHIILVTIAPTHLTGWVAQHPLRICAKADRQINCSALRRAGISTDVIEKIYS